ncbi:MAG: hypothetical protein HC848_07250 [Limnobacter sp.]|nr:hypothetical protein [Limnobacter sp.]
MKHENHTEGSVFNKAIPASKRVAQALLSHAKTVALTFDERQALPHSLTATDGSTLACHVHDAVEVGDKLLSPNNDWAIVQAKPEELLCVQRGQVRFEEMVHVAGLQSWPVQLTSQAALLIASHECQHFLEHYGLSFTTTTAPFVEISVPELAHHECCDHDHTHAQHPAGHTHGPDCTHNHS